MPIVDNEQDVKKESLFLEYETGDMGNTLILKSKLYRIPKHFLKAVSQSVLCIGEDCLYCAANYESGTEYNYKAFLNGKVGFLDIKASVFFAIQKTCKAQGRDARSASWTVIKKGEKLGTRYTTSKNDNLAPEDIKQAQAELEANTKQLVDVMAKQEEKLLDNYGAYAKEIREQQTPQAKEQFATEGKPQADPEFVDPEEIPF